MQQNHWRAATRDVVENFGVIADDLFHEGDYKDSRAGSGPLAWVNREACQPGSHISRIRIENHLVGDLHENRKEQQEANKRERQEHRPDEVAVFRKKIPAESCDSLSHKVLSASKSYIISPDISSRMRDLLLPCRGLCLEEIWLFRHDDPRDNICQKAPTTEECSNQPHYAYQRHIEIKVLAHAKADAGNFPSFARPHQALASDNAANSGTAVRANIGVILNGLPTVVAVHTVLHELGYAQSKEKVPCKWVNGIPRTL
jgi:hypothetical protein